MNYPISRPRRLRQNQSIRNLVAETNITASDLIYPLFVIEGQGEKNPIPSMPNIFQFSIDTLLEEVIEAYKFGIKAVILFGVTNDKDETGSSSFSADSIVPKAIKYLKTHGPQDLLVIADICLCEYTSHGHCGCIQGDEVVNDPSLDLLARQALACARAGVDVVAPSDMMDGRVLKIRNVLDSNGYINIPIMSYSAKYASAFYGPFRDAAGSAPQFGNRNSYQMDIRNSKEALKEIELDIEEGADIIMVKPALSCLDIIFAAQNKYTLPIAAYSVSGEYSMIKAAAQMGWINERKMVIETHTAIKRAGADMIITYWAKDLASWILNCQDIYK